MCDCAVCGVVFVVQSATAPSPAKAGLSIVTDTVHPPTSLPAATAGANTMASPGLTAKSAKQSKLAALSTKPPSDWQDAVVMCPDGVLGRVHSWRNGWVSDGRLATTLCTCGRIRVRFPHSATASHVATPLSPRTTRTLLSPRMPVASGQCGAVVAAAIDGAGAVCASGGLVSVRV